MPSLDDIFDLDPNINTNDSYIKSYPHLLSFFKGKTIFTETDFVCGAHMVYGWMPTVLDLCPLQLNGDFETGASLLIKAKNDANNALTNQDFKFLMDMVNNSIIGVSKLLHFVAPDKYPIWDTKIYAFYELGQRRPNQVPRPGHAQVNNIDKYLSFCVSLNEIQNNSRFIDFHQNVNNKLMYEVSEVRAIELVMFNNAPDFTKVKKNS